MDVEKLVLQEQRRQNSVTGTLVPETSSSIQLTFTGELGGEAHAFHKHLGILVSGLNHKKKAALHTIYGNFSFAAAAIGFSSHPSWWNIENSKGLKAQMSRYVFRFALFR
jgi:hypothetical protein